MEVYLTLFLIGFLGFVAMLVMGAGHGGGAGHHVAPQVGHVGGHAQIGHGPAAGHGHGSAQQTQGHQHDSRGSERRGAGLLLSFLSPLTIFSICLGAGVTGVLLEHFHRHGAIAVLAALGGLAFYGALVRPMMGFVMNFVSTPSKALEGSVAQTAEAIGHFDATGHGIVKLTVDGQIVRVLAMLETDERMDAGSIQPGEKLMVTSVDGRANTCRVARI